MSAANLAGHLQRFFTDRMLGQLGASPHTAARYRDTFRLLLKFASKHHRRKASDLRVEDLDPELVRAIKAIRRMPENPTGEQAAALTPAAMAGVLRSTPPASIILARASA